MMRNASARLLYLPVILKMALSFQLRDAHLMASTSASTLLSWQLQNWPAPELQHSVRKVRFSIALAMAHEQNVTILSNLATLAPTSFALRLRALRSRCFSSRITVAHCATVKQFIGEIPEPFVAMVLALFYPYSGISRALESIVRYSRLRRTNELQRAARAGALCTVVRSNE